MLNDHELIVILGSPRSGSTWLQAMLGSHPRVATTVELRLFRAYAGQWLRAWEEEVAASKEHGWPIGLPVLWSEEEFTGFLGRFIAETYQRVLALKPGATHVLDKHPSYSFHVDDIEALVPRARYVHIVRDGRDVAASLVAVSRKTGLHRRTGWGAEEIEGAARVWREHTEAAMSARRLGDRYLELRYEELLADGAGAFRRALDFCGLPTSEEELQAILSAHEFDKMKKARASADPRHQIPAAHYRKGGSGGWKDDLSPVEQFRFDRRAGALLRELGYASDGWWAQSSTERWSVPVQAALQRLVAARAARPKHAGG